MLETRRAKECQRGIVGAAERAKEGDRVPSESSDTRLERDLSRVIYPKNHKTIFCVGHNLFSVHFEFWENS